MNSLGQECPRYFVVKREIMNLLLIIETAFNILLEGLYGLSNVVK